MEECYERVASLDVDATNCFTDACPDELPVPGGSEIAAELNKQAEYALFRVCSKDAHPSNAIWRATKKHPQLSKIKGQNVDLRWNMHSVPGTKGFELISGLPDIINYHFIIYKGLERGMHPYGACYHDLKGRISTGLIEFLECRGVNTVIIGGLATEYCVKTTAIQLRNAGFHVVVNLAACRGLDPQKIKKAVKEMKERGIVIVRNSKQIPKVLS